MSDDRDETRPFAPSGDANRRDDATRAEPDDATRLHNTHNDDAAGTPEAPPGVAEGDHATRAGGAAGDDAPPLDAPRAGAAEGDATQFDIPRVGAAGDDATRLDNPRVDATQPDNPEVSGVPGDDATRLQAAQAGPDDMIAEPGQVPPVRKPRPDSTSVMPAADDWAPGRGNPAWTGRAEVRAPRPGGAIYAEEDWAAPPSREPRDRWWMPILVGIIALLLLAALGFGIYLIVQNSGNDTPAPSVSTPATQPPVTDATTTPTTEPTTVSTTEQPTTEPVATEVPIPALVGLSLPEAQAALARSGLQTYKLIYRENDAPPGTVIGSDPAEGQVVPPDTTVTLVIARPGTTAPATTATTTGSTQEPGTGGD